MFLCKYLFSNCLDSRDPERSPGILLIGEFGLEGPEKGARGAWIENSPLANGEWHKVAKACGARGFARKAKKPPGGVQEASWILDGARNRIRTCDLHRVKMAF